jgi:hypothetical protein
MQLKTRKAWPSPLEGLSFCLTRFSLRVGMMLPFLPRSIPAFAKAFTTAAMVPLCPHTTWASKPSSLTMVVM